MAKALTILGLCLEPPKPALLAGLDAIAARFDGKPARFICAPKRLKVAGAVMVPEPRHLPKHTYQKMAVLRNAVLLAWREAGSPGDVVLWVDLDVAGFSNLSGLDRLLATDDWDAVATFGVHEHAPHAAYHPGPARVDPIDGITRCYFDCVAYETRTGTRHLPLKTSEKAWRATGKIPAHCPVSFEPMPVSFEHWTECHSAFGPACFYQANRLDGLWYDPKTQQCEHQDFHAKMRANGCKTLFVAHDIVAHYDRLPASK